MGWTAVHFAARHNHKIIVDHLLCCCGLTVDTDDNSGCTPLWLAACYGHVDCTDVLLVHGANPDHRR